METTLKEIVIGRWDDRQQTLLGYNKLSLSMLRLVELKSMCVF